MRECRVAGRYSYCWPRDAVFITKAFDILKMDKETERFYKIFCKKTQSENGMWEQRFYTDGKLAPCWGYQIDETASVIYGIYEHYKISNKIAFLKSCLGMCEKAVDYLKSYIDNIIANKQIQKSYDLWEMNEGIHLYSISSIYAAFNSMREIYREISEVYNINVDYKVKELEIYILKTKNYIKENFIKNNCLVRNKKDELTDISILGTVIPFEVFDLGDIVIKNIITKINLNLRTYTGGYLRFEKDHYRGGQDPWIISTLWMAMYFKKNGQHKKAQECMDFVVNSANEHGFLSEQVNNRNMQSSWVIGLGWSHAMFIIVCEMLL
ncbi:MAG: glycoside hydrolase family 15 protein [Clostridia bacterium]|nr:glycoside hydrolase family 15 protein [Clostridia bacterium]